MYKNSRVALLGFMFTVAVFTGCNFGDGRPAAERAITRFHSMLNDERYEELYAAADPKLKEITTEKELLEFLQAVHIKLGKVTSTKTEQANMENSVTKTQIVMVQQTEFERGNGAETFTFFYANNKVSLAGYNINSKELTLRQASEAGK